MLRPWQTILVMQEWSQVMEAIVVDSLPFPVQIG